MNVTTILVSLLQQTATETAKLSQIVMLLRRRLKRPHCSVSQRLSLLLKKPGVGCLWKWYFSNAYEALAARSFGVRRGRRTKKQTTVDSRSV